MDLLSELAQVRDLLSGERDLGSAQVVLEVLLKEDNAIRTRSTEVEKRGKLYLDLLGTGDDEDLRALSKQPRKHNLAGGGTVLGTDGGEFVRKLDDLGEVVRVETGDVLGVVAVGNRLRCALYKVLKRKPQFFNERLFTVSLENGDTHERAGEETTTERRVSDDCDAKFLCSLEEVELLELDVEG